MAKLVLNDIQSGFNTGPGINANNDLIEAAVENTLSRDGTSPNEMEADLDMGGFKVTNLAAPVADSDAARKIDILDVSQISELDWDNITDKPDTIEDLATLVDPNADRILFWDDSTGQLVYLTPGANLTITDTTINASGGGGGGGAVNVDSHPASPDAMDDEFEEASLNARWTWLDQGTSTATFDQGSIHLQSPTEATLHVRGIEQTHTGPGRYQLKSTGVNPNNFNSGGVYFRNSSTGRLIILATHRVAQNYGVFYFTDALTFSSAPVGDTVRSTFAQPPGQGWMYAEMEDDGTNFIVRLSNTGINGMYTVILSATHAAFVGTPDRVGLCVFASSSTTPGRLYCDWFRKVS
jgi:hypothetical protein